MSLKVGVGAARASIGLSAAPAAPPVMLPPPPTHGHSVPGVQQVSVPVAIQTMPTPAAVGVQPVYVAPSVQTRTAARPTEVGSDMSLFSEIGRVAKQVAQVGGAFAAGGPVGGLAAAAATLAPRTSPAAAMPAAAFAGGLPAVVGAAGRVATALGRSPLVQTAAGSAVGTWLGANTSSCGCNGKRNHRDPCTGQKLSNAPALRTSLFGNCCPPGTRLIRRAGLDRNICAKLPKMNPFNPAALARADRRLTSFARRSTAMLRDMGFDVSARRKVKLKRKRARR